MEEVVRVHFLELRFVVDCCVWGAGPHDVLVRVETGRLHERKEILSEAVRQVAEANITIMGHRGRSASFRFWKTASIFSFFL